VTSRRGSNVLNRCKVATHREQMTKTVVADYKICLRDGRHLRKCTRTPASSIMTVEHECK
jgi:predicted transcriptional regulator